MSASTELHNIKTSLNTAIVGREIMVFDEVESTNDLAKLQLSQNAPDGLVIVADSQTRGRGRMGRSWHSEPGAGIYFSILLKPHISPSHCPRLTLMSAVAVVQAINKFSKTKATLKWPNDILINKKKLCGILSEYCKNQNQDAVIIGIGVNANHTQFPEQLSEIATSLRIENREPVDRVELLRSILVHLDEEYLSFMSDKEYPLAQKWTRHSDMFGKTISLTLGTEKTSGVALRLDNAGNLIVRTEDGRELSIDSGEVILG